LFAASPGHVLAAWRLRAQAHNDQRVQWPIGLAVATAVETVALLVTRVRITGRDPADFGGGALGAESGAVVADGDKQRRGDLGADAETGQAARGRPGACASVLPLDAWFWNAC